VLVTSAGSAKRGQSSFNSCCGGHYSLRDSTLITGGAGFLGAHLARALARRGDRVVAYDNFLSGVPESLKDLRDTVKLVHGDILDVTFLIRTMMAEKVKKVIHTAALVSFAPSIEKPAFTAKINIEGTVNVLEASRILGIERVLDISSEEVYGTFQYEPADEDHPLSPATPYAITKTTAENYEKFFYKFFGLDIIIIRTSWVYGVGLPRSRPPKTFIENSLKGIPTAMDCGADHRIDHTYIDDFVQGALLAFDVKAPRHRVFNIASGEANTYREMIRMIQKIIPGANITVGSGLIKQTENLDAPQKGALDIKRAATELGYQPKYGLFEGLKQYVVQLNAERFDSP
jgi:UDP-glucose 4-epimerase